MTIASAQGLTVDRAFLLVDDRPARETIYPAATRHREGIDIYVNRKPITFDIADRRPEDEANRPVLDSDVRAWLAERWSRSEPKEAALDYTTDGMWRDAREAVRTGIGSGRDRPRSAEHRGPGDDRVEHAEVPLPAANDNAVLRIARKMRHAVAGWRHGTAVDAFTAERAEVLTAWDALRERTRDQGDAVALSPAYRETLERHAALLKEAATFEAGPTAVASLLAECGGIGRDELREFAALHVRALRHRRAAVMRQVHRARREEQGQEIRPEEARDVLPDDRPGQLFSLGTEARQGELALEGGGARSCSAPIGETRVKAAGKAEALLAAAERHMDAHRALRDATAGQDIEVTELSGYADWRSKANRILNEGKAILSDEAACRTWLLGEPADTQRLQRLFTGLGRTIRDDDEALARARREAREKRQRSVLFDRLKLTTDTGAQAPAHAGAGNDTPDRVLWWLRRIHDWDGRAAERDKQAQSLERWQTVREIWNRQVDRAEQEGVHVIYTRGYETLREDLASIARDDPYRDHSARGEIRTVLRRLDLAEEGRATVGTHRDRLNERLAYRDDVRGLNASAAWDKRPIPDREHYDGWRDSAEETIAAAERILAERRKHGIHLDGLDYQGESLASAIADLRKILTEDDRYVAATLAEERPNEDVRTRQDRIAALLDDPGTLSEMRKQRDAARREARRHEEGRRRGRHHSRGISM